MTPGDCGRDEQMMGGGGRWLGRTARWRWLVGVMHAGLMGSLLELLGAWRTQEPSRWIMAAGLMLEHDDGKMGLGSCASSVGIALPDFRVGMGSGRCLRCGRSCCWIGWLVLGGR
ncbi:hypothetical protein ACLOJK_004273 [Asimina triloba]